MHSTSTNVFGSIIARMMPTATQTVSYTQLDVYKRQDAAHANLCMKWGKGILVFEIGFMILNNVLNFTAGIAVDATHTSANPAAIQIFSLIPYVFLAFYIIGAYKHQKSA